MGRNELARGERQARMTHEQTTGLRAAGESAIGVPGEGEGRLTRRAAMVNRGAGLARRLRADRELRRVVAFLIAGGISALVTLTVTAALTDLWHQRFLWAAIAGTELGILVNFAVNDHLAFRDLAGHRRAFPLRLARYHVTCAAGQSIILLLSLLLYDGAHLPTMLAQGVPIVVVTAFNFVMHRFWTYRAMPR